MSLIEIIQAVAAALGAGLGGWVYAWRQGRHASADRAEVAEALGRIEGKLGQYEERFERVEARLSTVERGRFVRVQTPATGRTP